MSVRNLFVATLMVGASALACSPDCMSICEETQDEDCEALNGADCDKTCEAAEDIVEKGGCEDDWNDWLSCLDGADDLCDAYKEECGSEGDQFEDCVGEYCEDHPNSSSCKDLDEEID